MCELQKFDGRNDKREIGINPRSRYYPKHYITPKRWMRNIFHIKSSALFHDTFYFELLVSLFLFNSWAAFNTVLFIAVGCDKSITGILIISHICLIIINMIFFSIMSWVFKRE